MGLDVHVHLIIGVPLLELGEVRETEETVKLFDVLGKPTGREAVLREVYFCPPGREMYLIGTNHHLLGKNYYAPRHVTYDYSKLLGLEDEDDVDCEFIHGLVETACPDTVIVGLEPQWRQAEQLDRVWEVKTTTLPDIEATFPKVREYLKERFGYEGPIYVIAVTEASY